MSISIGEFAPRTAQSSVGAVEDGFSLAQAQAPRASFADLSRWRGENAPQLQRMWDLEGVTDPQDREVTSRLSYIAANEKGERAAEASDALKGFFDANFASVRNGDRRSDEALISARIAAWEAQKGYFGE